LRARHGCVLRDGMMLALSRNTDDDRPVGEGLPAGSRATAMPPSVVAGFEAAIRAAVEHLGATAPNPPVGCALLDEAGAILAAAGHPRAGAPHAEAQALAACREAGLLERARTAIVTLEPCNHQGRTPPCTEALLASPLRSVWVGAADPNPRVVGGGAARLRDAGLAVHAPPPDSRAAQASAALIAPFACASLRGRPWITVKQALDARGSMIPPAGATTFTGPEALRLAHRLRRATDAIVTGIGTVLADRPHFTVRHVPDHPGRRRLLAVADRQARLPAGYAGDAAARGLELLSGPDLPALFERLGREGALWAMVEAGPTLLAEIERLGLWDDWLTIRHGADGQDAVSIRTRRSPSPLLLLDGLSQIEASEVP